MEQIHEDGYFISEVVYGFDEITVNYKPHTVGEAYSKTYKANDADYGKVIARIQAQFEHSRNLKA